MVSPYTISCTLSVYVFNQKRKTGGIPLLFWLRYTTLKRIIEVTHMRTLLFTAQAYSCNTYSRGSYGKAECDDNQQDSTSASSHNQAQAQSGSNSSNPLSTTPQRSDPRHETFMTQMTHAPSEAAATIAHTSYWILLPIIFVLAIFIAWILLLWKRRRQRREHQRNGSGFTPPNSPLPPQA